MNIITLSKVNASPRCKEPHESILIFILIGKNICNTAFSNYKISNLILNELIFFRPNNAKHLVSSLTLINPYTLLNQIRDVFASIKVL